MEAHGGVGRGCSAPAVIAVMAEGVREWAAEFGRNPTAEVRQNTSSSSSSSFSSNLALAARAGSSECGLDGMELDAARALACFSLTAVRESGGRGRKRRKNGTSGGDWDNCVEGRGFTSVPEDNQAIKVIQEEEMKLEQSSERPPAISSKCSSNHFSASSGRKLWQNLTQAEREARRMNRVLANRESARQTIRRRQAIRDDLKKKVSELSLDNQNMKMEKERVMKEYMLLKNKNKQLKVEMAMAIECNILGAEATSASLERSSSPHEFLFSGYFGAASMSLPPWSVMGAHVGMFFDDSDSHKAIGPRALFYVPPCAWFYSLLRRMSSSSLMPGTWRDKESDLLTVNCKEAVVKHKTDDHLAPRRESSAEVKSFKLDIDLNFGGEMLEPLLDALDQCSSVRDEPESNVKAARNVMGMVEAVEEQSAKSIDVDAAAAARRKRKEIMKIMKLKHLCHN